MLPSLVSCLLSPVKVWKGEAFRLWVDLWASLYDDESKSAELLHEVHDTYYLVAVVDNNFIDGNLWEVRNGVIFGIFLPGLMRCHRISRFGGLVFNVRRSSCVTCHVGAACELSRISQ